MNLTFNKKKNLMLSELQAGDIFIFEHALDESNPDLWLVTNNPEDRYCLIRGDRVGHMYTLTGCSSYEVALCSVNGEINLL